MHANWLTCYVIQGHFCTIPAFGRRLVDVVIVMNLTICDRSCVGTTMRWWWPFGQSSYSSSVAAWFAAAADGERFTSPLRLLWAWKNTLGSHSQTRASNGQDKPKTCKINFAPWHIRYPHYTCAQSCSSSISKLTITNVKNSTKIKLFFFAPKTLPFTSYWVSAFLNFRFIFSMK